MPDRSLWFDVGTIHKYEYRAMNDYFPKHKTQKERAEQNRESNEALYKQRRGFMVDLYCVDPTNKICIATVGKEYLSIVKFLESWGIIHCKQKGISPKSRVLIKTKSGFRMMNVPKKDYTFEKEFMESLRMAMNDQNNISQEKLDEVLEKIAVKLEISCKLFKCFFLS